VLAAIAFAAMLVLGPLTEHTAAEKVFAASLAGLGLLIVLFASGRIAFALIATARRCSRRRASIRPARSGRCSASRCG
jgi:hypothetical protein